MSKEVIVFVIQFEGASEGCLVHPQSRVSTELRPGCSIPSAFHWQVCKKAGKDSSPASSLNFAISSNCLFSATPWLPVEPKTSNRAVALQKSKVKLSSLTEELSLDSAVCCRNVTCHSNCPVLLSLCREGEVKVGRKVPDCAL